MIEMVSIGLDRFIIPTFLCFLFVPFASSPNLFTNHFARSSIVTATPRGEPYDCAGNQNQLIDYFYSGFLIP